MIIPWLTRAFIASLFANLLLWINTNAVGIIGLYVAVSGVSYMSGWKFPSKLIVPLCLLLIVLRAV